MYKNGYYNMILTIFNIRTNNGMLEDNNTSIF